MMTRCTTHLLAATLAVSSLVTVPTAVADEQFIGNLVYRSGAYATSGIPYADGFSDYIQLLNERDGGINGVRLDLEECDFGYNTDKGVECYERMKNKGATGLPAVMPLSTGVTYALLDRVVKDRIPLITSGYGRADAVDGTVFPWVFVPPATYWSGADVAIQYIHRQLNDLNGKNIALVYHDSAYGKEPIKTLEHLATRHGFTLHRFPVPHPGLEQKATWLKIGRQLRPDYTLMWGWGVMSATAIKEAAAVGYPRDRFIGIWWSGNEPDVIPAGAASIGYKSLQFSGMGNDFALHHQIREHLYANGKGAADAVDKIGQIPYNRGVQTAILLTEALRGAMARHGHRPVTGAQVRDALDNLNIDTDRLAALGAEGLFDPVKLSCADHAGKSRVQIVQWDGSAFKPVSDWIEPNNELMWTLYRESAARYAKEKGITPRRCE